MEWLHFSWFLLVFPIEDGESLLVFNSLLLKVLVTTSNESIATDRQLNNIVFIPSLASLLFPHQLHPDYYTFWLRMRFHRCSVFLQTLLGKTYHNSPKTYKSEKHSTFLQNFAKAMYKFKNKRCGCAIWSYMNSCIRPRVITLFSWPLASSKVATTYNNNKGTLSTFELFKHLTFDNGKWGKNCNWTMVDTTSYNSEPSGKPSKPWISATFLFFLVITFVATTWTKLFSSSYIMTCFHNQTL